MTILHLQVDDELLALIEQTARPADKAVRELMVLELYRRGAVSSGKAADLLGMQRIDFIRHAGQLGIPHVDMSDEEWDRERDRSALL